MNYLLHIGVMLGIYGMLALSANLLIGFGGLLSMTQAAFYGLGAYTYALLSLKFGLPFFVTLPAAIALCALVGWLFGHAALRFRNEAFVLATAYALGDRFHSGGACAHPAGEFGWSAHGWRLAAAARRISCRNKAQARQR